MERRGRSRRRRRTARRAARSRGLLRSGRPLPASLVAADDRDTRAASPAFATSSRSARGPTPVVMAAALEAGVTRLFRIGGAHAIAALAYGTAYGSARGQDRRSGQRATSPPQRRSSPPTAPSTSTPGRPRSVIVAARWRPEWIAADLIAQAEHDPDAAPILITPSRTLATRVAAAVAAADAADGSRARIARAQRRHRRHARRSTRRSSSPTRIAPEHMVVDDERMAQQVPSAGSVFVGAVVARRSRATTPSAPITCCRPAGAARFRGGLSALRTSCASVTVQRVTAAGLAGLRPP